MGRNIIFVALGGMLGTVGRFLLTTSVAAVLPTTFPLGTFLVNLTGCFAMGAVVGIAERYHWFHDEWRIFLTVGFCGGFTTFSAFALDNIVLLQDKNYGTFAAYSIASFVLCISAAFLGLMLVKG